MAPAGTTISLADLASWAGGLPARRRRLEELRGLISDRFGVRHVLFVSSGRAAMTLILEAMAERSEGRNELLVPGYTCYSVAASAVRAGLAVRPLDVDPETLDVRADTLSAAVSERSLVFSTANLFGMPNDLGSHERIAKERSIFLIDDAAQSLGAAVDGRAAGTFGDVGIFSFDKGKNITTLQGGVIVTNDDGLAERLEAMLSERPDAPLGAVASQSVALLAYAMLLRPRLYWIPNRMLSLGGTPWEVDYPTTRYAPALAPLALRLLRRLDELSDARRRVAEAFRAGVSEIEGVVCPEGFGRGVFPRCPLLLGDRTVRDRAIDALQSAGIGATGSYPAALIDVPEVGPHLAPGVQDTPGARSVADRILTLPTHAFVTPSDIRRTVGVLRSVVEPYRARTPQPKPVPEPSS